jgi:hypothetical protein
MSGVIFNRNGVGPVVLDLVLVDPDGNEFVVATAISIADGQSEVIDTSGLSIGGFIVLLSDWTLLARVTSGDVASGQGVVAWPWCHDMTRNVMPIIAELTTTELEIGPPKGRGWQLTGNLKAQAFFSGDLLQYVNFDSVPRNVQSEIFYLAGENIQSDATIAGPPAVGPIAVSGIEPGFEAGGDQYGLILAYPDKIKVRAAENQTTAPLYMFANFTEFDLPRDMG